MKNGFVYFHQDYFITEQKTVCKSFEIVLFYKMEQ